MNRLIETEKMHAAITGYFHGILESVGMIIDTVDTNAELNTLVDMVAAAGSYPVDGVVRDKGEWIYDKEKGKLICPFCGKGLNVVSDMQAALSMDVEHFCYSCGADLQGGKHLETI